MSGEPSIVVRIAVCPEDKGDGKEWSFYLINDSAASLDTAVLKKVGHEWGNMGSTEEPGTTVKDIAPGANVLLWRDNDEELRMFMELRVRSAGSEVSLYFEFPLLYKYHDRLVPIAGLGKNGWAAGGNPLRG